MKLRHIFPLFSALALLAASPAHAETPRLQAGKKSVFERVVSHPNAKIYADPERTKELSTPRTFTSFYVYGDQRDMLRVGVSASKADGWIKKDETTFWPHAVTMEFTDQMGRKPVLFFRDHESLVQLCSSESLPKTVEQYATLFGTPGSHKPADLPVIAAEPTGEEGQVSQNNFYLLPVLDVDAQLADSHGTKLLNVACINPGIQKGPEKEKEDPAKEEGKAAASSDEAAAGLADAMPTGIAFVIDTTRSMKPYIDKAREVVRTMYDRLQKSVAKEKVSFAVVAFRSDVEKSPAIKYNTQVVSDFTSVANRKELEALLSRVEECRASTHAFDEDALSGVKQAVDALSWDKVDARTMILVTDAGPLQGEDSATGMDAETMADYLRTNNIILTTLHIKSPAGRSDHEYAEERYKKLSVLSSGEPSYIAVPAPTTKQGSEVFNRSAKEMADVFCKYVEKQINSEDIAAPQIEPENPSQAPEEKARHLAEIIGYAMHLQFVGDHKETTAPQVVDAWMADCDLSNLVQNEGMAPIRAAEPALLLTKMQLSQLRKQVQEVITTIEDAFLVGKQVDLYDQIISAAAKISVDPTGFSHEPDQALLKKGVLLEVLDGLPYRSPLLNYTHDDWASMSHGELVKTISRLKSLVRRYEEYDRDNTHWESFGSANTNDWVYRVPLSVLP